MAADSRDLDSHDRVCRRLVRGFLTLDAISPAAKHAGDALIRRLGQLLPRDEQGGSTTSSSRRLAA
jgi:hypothetical protein